MSNDSKRYIDWGQKRKVYSYDDKYGDALFDYNQKENQNPINRNLNSAIIDKYVPTREDALKLYSDRRNPANIIKINYMQNDMPTHIFDDGTIWEYRPRGWELGEDGKFRIQKLQAGDISDIQNFGNPRAGFYESEGIPREMTVRPADRNPNVIKYSQYADEPTGRGVAPKVYGYERRPSMGRRMAKGGIGALVGTGLGWVGANAYNNLQNAQPLPYDDRVAEYINSFIDPETGEYSMID